MPPGRDAPRAPLTPGRGSRRRLRCPRPAGRGASLPPGRPSAARLCACRGAEEELAKSFGLKTHLFAASRARRQGPLCAARGSARGRHTKAAAPLRSAPQVSESGPRPHCSGRAPSPGPRAQRHRPPHATAMGAPGRASGDLRSPPRAGGSHPGSGLPGAGRALPGWGTGSGWREAAEKGDWGRGRRPPGAGSPERSQERAWRCERMEFGRESGLLEGRRVEAAAPYPTPHSSGKHPTVVECSLLSTGGDPPIGARGAAPERGSTTARLSGGRGKKAPDGAHSTASTLRREQGAEVWEGAACSPLCSQCRGRTLFPWSTFSSLRGEGEAACRKAPQPPALLPSAPPGKPPGRANALAHGHLLGLPFPGSRELPAVAVLGTPGHGLPERWAPRVPGCLPGGWEAAQPAQGGQLSPAPATARASCNLSRAKPSREVPRLEKGLRGSASPATAPFPGAHGDTTEGSGAGEDVWPALGEVHGTTWPSLNGVQRGVQAFPLQ